MAVRPASLRARAGAPARCVREHVAAILLFGCVLFVPTLAAAQGPGWDGQVEANASVFFGATEQQLLAASLALSRNEKLVSFSARTQVRYGEAGDASGNHFVSSRSWLASLSADGMPEGQISPFVFGTVESSFEKRIWRRYSGGGGAKWTFTRAPSGDASISLAAIGERTQPTDASPENPTRSLVRWSARAKTQWKATDKLTFSHVTFYQPVVSEFSRFLVTSTTELAYALNASVSLTTSLADNYDSEARARGARANNDGHLLFGIRSGF